MDSHSGASQGPLWFVVPKKKKFSIILLTWLYHNSYFLFVSLLLIKSFVLSFITLLILDVHRIFAVHPSLKHSSSSCLLHHTSALYINTFLIIVFPLFGYLFTPPNTAVSIYNFMLYPWPILSLISFMCVLYQIYSQVLIVVTNINFYIKLHIHMWYIGTHT